MTTMRLNTKCEKEVTIDRGDIKELEKACRALIDKLRSEFTSHCGIFVSEAIFHKGDALMFKISYPPAMEEKVTEALLRNASELRLLIGL